MATEVSGPSAEDVAAFPPGIRGAVIQPSDVGYDDARRVYNAMIDKRPALIVRCDTVADVVQTVGFARRRAMPLAIRGGGHNGGGLGTVDDGVVLDLSRMNGVLVDPEARTVRVEGGATWGKVDHATHAFGLAVPSGIISTTGVGGLTLGGGLGHLTRRYGLTIDNLIGADVVLADGSFVHADEDTHSDLFWALRGGGGNFGVVTAFDFRLNPVDIVVGGPTLWDLSRAKDVLKWYADFILNAPNELNGFFLFLTVPPGPPFPEELHLKKMCGVVWCYTGSLDKADEVFGPIRAFGPPVLHGVHEMPFPALNSAFDGLYPTGDQWYWRADFVNELTDTAIDRHIEHAHKMPTMQSSMHLYPIDGAARRKGSDETAWSFRDANFAQVIVGVDPDPANAGVIRAWAVDYWEDLHPHSAGGAYVNFMMDEGHERVEATYRGNYTRLVEIKSKYDPSNLFRVNQNVRPRP
jgi:hypothetical protein